MINKQYVDRGGSQVLLQPYLANGVDFYGFVIEADVTALQKNLCDHLLNEPSGGAVKFEPAGPYVVVAFNNLRELRSKNPPDSQKGFFSEQECAIWTLLIDRQREREFWFHPYIFVDQSYALCLGREMYGFPKSIGWFQIPDSPQSADSFSAETLVLATYSPQTKGTRTQLVGVERTGAPVAGPTFTEFRDLVQFVEEVGGFFEKQGSLLKDAELALHTVSDLIHRRAPMAFLKQFPDVATPGNASYMSIVETPAYMTQFHSGGLLHSQYEVSITPCDSHPVVQDLGLAGNKVTPMLSFYVNFDFEIDSGTEIWRAE